MNKRYTPPVTELLLVAPADPNDAFGIVQGSAIVAAEREGYLLCHYEGGIYQPMAWEEKLTHAAGRLAHRYPTTSFISVEDGSSKMKIVGSLKWDAYVGCWIVSDITDRATLERWTGQPVAIGATDEQKRSAAGLALSTGGTSAILAWETAKASGTDPIKAVLDHMAVSSV